MAAARMLADSSASWFETPGCAGLLTMRVNFQAGGAHFFGAAAARLHCTVLPISLVPM